MVMNLIRLIMVIILLYIYIKPLRCTPETNIMLHVILQFLKKILIVLNS